MQSFPSASSFLPGDEGNSWAELDPGEHGDDRTDAFGSGMLGDEEDYEDDNEAPDEEKSEVIRQWRIVVFPAQCFVADISMTARSRLFLSLGV